MIYALTHSDVGLIGLYQIYDQAIHQATKLMVDQAIIKVDGDYWVTVDQEGRIARIHIQRIACREWDNEGQAVLYISDAGLTFGEA